MDEYRFVDPATGADTAIARSMSAFCPVPTTNSEGRIRRATSAEPRAESLDLRGRDPGGLQVSRDAPVPCLQREHDPVHCIRRGLAQLLTPPAVDLVTRVGQPGVQGAREIRAGERVVATDLVERHAIEAEQERSDEPGTV